MLEGEADLSFDVSYEVRNRSERPLPATAYFSEWDFKNALPGYDRPMTVSEGLTSSVNSATAAQAAALDLCEIRDVYSKLGVHRAVDGEPMVVNNPSFVIGGQEVSPLTMAAAFATFASGGEYCEPIALTEVTDSEGKSYEIPEPACEQVLEPGVAAAISKPLQDLVQEMPGKPWGIRSIPEIDSRYPIWDQPDLVRDIDEGRFYLADAPDGRRETPRVVLDPVQERPMDGDGRRDARGVSGVHPGVLDVLPNGSGFMRSDAFSQSRDDVYVSPAQIRRCELRAGDEISGPVRRPRRSAGGRVPRWGSSAWTAWASGPHCSITART